MGELITSGTTWLTFPEEVAITFALYLRAGRYVLLLERGALAAPLFLGADDAASILSALGALMPCAAPLAGEVLLES